MNRRRLLLAALPCLVAPRVGAATEPRERADWARHFDAAQARGTVVVVDTRAGREAAWTHDPRRAGQRFTPASTFKIPHTLFALDAGLVRDEFEKIAWDGVRRPVAAWNADQDLRSAMRNSTVWVYERFAARLGPERETAYLRRIGYGNQKASGAEPFWVEGQLAISAFEQVAMLQALHRNVLPFDIAHQRLVKDLLVNEAGPDWILRAKTGWSGALGWWTGWVERPTGAVFFALNIDTPGRTADLAKRTDIARAILRSIDALPGG
ncbi:MAG: class D beta-lactamase [Comamonadaceae bacterium]|nr:MAG: class D beta-lactamase [Comamonadaceae bacterium]